MHFPPFSRHWQVFGTARTGQARAVCARRSEPLTSRTVLEHGAEGKGGGSGSGRNSTAEASNLPAMTELSPQDYTQSTKPADVSVSICEENDQGPSASHQEVQIAAWPQTGPNFGSM